MRILEPALELGREAFECPRLLVDRARKTTRNRVDQNHRGQVAVRQNVRPDRNRIGGKMLDDAFVEASNRAESSVSFSSSASSSPPSWVSWPTCGVSATTRWSG